jgi:hypothetical protein
MDNPHALRSKGWSGLAFVVVLIASLALTGTPPDANAAEGVIAGYLSVHHRELLVAGWLSFPALAFFLWYLVGISGYLRRMSTEDEGLPTFALVSGLYTAVVAFVGGVLSTALAFAPAGPGAVKFVWGLSALANGAFIAMGLAIFVFAVAHSMRRHNSGAPWLVWLGYVTALAEAVMTFGMFYRSGVALGNDLAGLVLGFGLFALWMIAVSATLITQGNKELAGSPA